MDEINGIKLIEAVNKKMERVRTKSLDLSFNELTDMYAGKELIINPAYQRLFRWSEGQQSRFIESLILEMPIPPIFVIEDKLGQFELIDGLQRIASFLHFRGQHPEYKDENQFLKLSECDIVAELNGHTFCSLPKPLEIRLKRSFVRVEVLREESDNRLRYYMFKRLNTGGEKLSQQEIRNCTIRLLDSKFNDFLIKLSQDANFINCIKNLSEEKIEEKGDQELVLRFFAFKNYRQKYVHDVADFMTEYMESVSDPDNMDVLFDYDTEESCFRSTFVVLNKTLGEHSFSGTNEHGSLISRFLSYHYEAFALGIQKYLNQIDQNDQAKIVELKNMFIEIKRSGGFQDMTKGGGKNYAKPLNDRIEYVENALAKLFL